MKKIILLSVILSCFIQIQAQTNKRWADVKAGNYTVGFKTILKYDRARMVKDATDISGNPFNGNRFRPVQISVWYPAAKGGTPMKFEDYLFVRNNFQSEIEGKPLTVAQKQNIVRSFKQTRISNGADEKLLDEFLKTDLQVFYNAPFTAGKFPLVLMPSGAYQLDNAALCEFLASHGYVAVHTPSYRPTLDYVADLEFAVNYLAENSNADPNEMGAVGFSYGGLVATIFQLKNRSLSAIVSLDGVDGWKWGADEILASTFYAIRKTDVPYLRFHNAKQDEKTNAATAKTDWRFYEAMRYADLMRIDFDKVTHLDFTSGALTRTFIPNFSPGAPNPDASLPLTQKIIQTYTLKFLDANVKKDTEAKAFLQKTPEQNGFPKESAVFSLKKGVRPPPSSTQIADVIYQKDGALTVRRIVNEMKAKGETLPGIFTENQMNAWGYELLNQNRLAEAVAAFELNVEFFPNSANALDSLAEGFERDGKLKQAAENYEKAYKLAEKNGDANLAKTAKANFERVLAKLK